MADEFVKGLAIATGAGLAWMILAGWYTTPGFEETQLIHPPPETVDVWGQIGLVVKDVLFWFAVVGTLTFWVIVPALGQLRATLEERRGE